MSKRLNFGLSGFSLGGNKKQRTSSPSGTSLLSNASKIAPPRTFGFSMEDDSSVEERKRPNPAELLHGKPQDGPEEEVDPLDAFMLGIDEQVQKEKANPKPKKAKAIRADIDEEEDEYAAITKLHKKEVAKHSKMDDRDDLAYDEHDNPIIVRRNYVAELPPLDHGNIKYESFERDFYKEHEDVARKTNEEIAQYRKLIDVHVSGFDVPRPASSFGHFSFDKVIMKEIRRQGFESPTPIQCQAVPAALSGRDIIGIAKTGSGKTLAFVWPMLVHVMDQRVLEVGEGPIAIICAPTRELAQQIYKETIQFARGFGIKVANITGGATKYMQKKALKEGAEVAVATTGRLIDLMKSGVLKCTRVTYLVLDEADKMFDMGFEPQVRSVVGQLRPDRQTLLFSATMKRPIEHLATHVLHNPVRIVVGRAGTANADVRQVAVVVSDVMEKWPWLLGQLPAFIECGRLLVFVSKREAAEELAGNLSKHGYPSVSIHGQKSHRDRAEAMKTFKSGTVRIMVATDVASRGLDIKDLKTVVNYDAARNIDAHTHRVGRTGRAGATDGTAYSLVTMKEHNFAADLVRNLQGAKQYVPPELVEVAKKSKRFRSKSRGRGGYTNRGSRVGGGRGRGRGGGVGGGGGGGGGGIGLTPSSSCGGSDVVGDGTRRGRGIGYHEGSSPSSMSMGSSPRGALGLGGFQKAAVGGESGSWAATVPQHTRAGAGTGAEKYSPFGDEGRVPQPSTTSTSTSSMSSSSNSTSTTTQSSAGAETEVKMEDAMKLFAAAARRARQGK